MVSLITENATLDIEKEAAMKQAQSASRAAETLMGDSGDKKDSETEKKFLFRSISFYVSIKTTQPG